MGFMRFWSVGFRGFMGLLGLLQGFAGFLDSSLVWLPDLLWV